MSTLEMANLQVEIARQSATVRAAERKYLIDTISRYVAGLVIIIAITQPITTGTTIFFLIGVLLLIITIFNVKQSHKELEAAEKTYLDLQTKLIDLS